MDAEEGSRSLFYLSFVGEEGWRGGTIVAEYSPEGAIRSTWRQGINPGGEAKFHEWPDDVPRPPDRFHNRLLSRTDLDAMDRCIASMIN